MADAIMIEFEKLRPVKDGEDRRFIELVDVIERSHNDLVKMDMEKEISNTRVVGEVEKRLPPSVKQEWFRSLYDTRVDIDRKDRFPALLHFLIKERKSVQYESSGIRSSPQISTPRATINAADVRERSENLTSEDIKRCLIHDKSKHTTAECRTYLNKSLADKTQIVKEKGACFCCLARGHRVSECRRKKTCGVSESTRLHHATLHDDSTRNNVTSPISAINNHTVTSRKENGACLLQLMQIRVGAGHMNVLFDGCVTSSRVTNKAAKSAGLRGNPVRVSITKVGGVIEEIDSFRYNVPLVDKQGFIIQIASYGIDRITSDIETIDVTNLVGLFNDVTRREIERPSGQVDLLIGYEYAGYQPTRLQAVDHLLVLENRFGRCLGGSHSLLKEKTKRFVAEAALVHHLVTYNVDEFFKLESMGVECNPRCGSCRFGKCPIGANDFTLKEARELALIEQNLTFCSTHWVAEYPWIKNPSELPNNRRVALSVLKSLELRLAKDPGHVVSWSCPRNREGIVRILPRAITLHLIVVRYIKAMLLTPIGLKVQTW